MRFVDDHQRVARQVIDQRRWRLARRTPGQVARIVLDALAEADLQHHLDIEARALLDALRLDQLRLSYERLLLLRQLDLDLFYRFENLVPTGHIMARRKHREASQLLADMAGQRVEQLQRLDLVVEQRQADRVVRAFRRKNVEHVAVDAERSAAEFGVVALILHLGQALDRVALRQVVALPQVQDHAVIFGGIADAVNRRDGGNDDAIRPLQDRLGCGKSHLLDVLVDRRVLLDVEVPRRHVRFRLVVVVVGDEILDRVVGKELAELGIELRGERLVRRQHQRRPAGARDDVGHGVGLARPGHAEQGLEREPVGETFDQLVDRLGLVARRGKRLVQLVGAVGKLEDHGVCRAAGHRTIEYSSRSARLAAPCSRSRPLLRCGCTQLFAWRPAFGVACRRRRARCTPIWRLPPRFQPTATRPRGREGRACVVKCRFFEPWYRDERTARPSPSRHHRNGAA